MNYKFGAPKDLDSITLSDVMEHPLWLWTWEAGLEGDFDEDWQVPVIGCSDVSESMTEPIITLKVADTDLYAEQARAANSLHATRSTLG
jgi:hypothetical protein